MRIAGRLALQAPSGLAGVCDTSVARLKSDILSFHGCDVVVSKISETGFEAALSVPLAKGALVRLRLPCAGSMLAKVVSHRKGTVKAEFVNPVSASRLGKALGMTHRAPQVAFA